MLGPKIMVADEVSITKETLRTLYRDKHSVFWVCQQSTKSCPLQPPGCKCVNISFDNRFLRSLLKKDFRESWSREIHFAGLSHFTVQQRLSRTVYCFSDSRHWHHPHDYGIASLKNARVVRSRKLPSRV